MIMERKFYNMQRPDTQFPVSGETVAGTFNTFSDRGEFVDPPIVSRWKEYDILAGFEQENVGVVIEIKEITEVTQFGVSDSGGEAGNGDPGS